MGIPIWAYMWVGAYIWINIRVYQGVYLRIYIPRGIPNDIIRGVDLGGKHRLYMEVYLRVYLLRG